MTLITKTPDFKSISGEMDTGGAPVYADDLLRIQENATADYINEAEDLRGLLPPMMYYQGSGNPDAPEFENGLILSGCQYDNTDPLNPIVSAGYILSGGVICYYAGGTYATGGTFAGILYLYKGAATYQSRVFNDGFSKEILVNYTATVELGAIGINGPGLAGGTAIVPTDEVVAIAIGTGSSNYTYGETNFSRQAARQINDIGARLNTGAFAGATLATGVTLPATGQAFMVSRIDGIYTEIVGTVDVNLATFSGVLFTLNSHNIDIATGGGVALFCQAQGSLLDDIKIDCRVFSAGLVSIDTTKTGFPVSGTETLQFQARVIGSAIAPVDSYTYNNDFMDITP
jgi:hypothetical protein